MKVGHSIFCFHEKQLMQKVVFKLYDFGSVIEDESVIITRNQLLMDGVAVATINADGITGSFVDSK